MLRTLLTTLTAVAFLSLAPTSSAQCVGPDGLSVPGCCQPTQANLPAFPQAFLPGTGICWNNCNATPQTNLRVMWDAPQFVACAQYTTRVTAIDGSTGSPLLSGPMVLDYTRTWNEIDPNTGNQLQVWRFVAKADLSSLVPTGTTPPCPVPTCLPPIGPNSSAFYYGYVDYATVCGAPPPATFESVLVLYHGCDFLQHKPLISSRPGVFHPTTSYAIVAPSSSASPFVAANLPAPGGPLVAEAMRKTSAPGGSCVTEEFINSGDILPFVVGCMCPPSLGGAAQLTLSLYRGIGTCPDATGVPSSFDALFLAFPTLPWPYLVTNSIGAWTGASTYPGQEIAWVDEALMKYRDSCLSTTFYEVFYGATTDGGWTVIPSSPNFPPTKRFKDMADNWSAPVVGFHPLPLLGNIMPTDHLIYTNVP